jgi:hypothetical protein
MFGITKDLFVGIDIEEMKMPNEDLYDDDVFTLFSLLMTRRVLDEKRTSSYRSSINLTG